MLPRRGMMRSMPAPTRLLLLQLLPLLAPVFSFPLASSLSRSRPWVAPFAVGDTSLPATKQPHEDNNNNNDHLIKISRSHGDESSIRRAAELMVDAFWLGSPQQLVLVPSSADAQDEKDDQTTTTTTVSPATRASLLEAQMSDLTETYGERMGRRLFETCLLLAMMMTTEDSSSSSQQQQEEEEEGMLLVGMLGMEVCLLDDRNNDDDDDDDNNNMVVVPHETAERQLKEAVALLGPKQRRQYRDAPLDELVADLSSSDVKVICCLSNLAVSPHARRRGVAKKLCDRAEQIARDEWGFDEMFLKVESANVAARDLYETRLGYEPVHTMKAAPAMRVVDKEGFVEIQAETILLRKSIVKQQQQRQQ